MTNDHPMQPTPEQIRQWCMWKPGEAILVETFWAGIARSAYAAGADAQLELCCEYFDNLGNKIWARRLGEVMRPKPPTLAEQALEILDDSRLDAAHENCIRRALERLAELEGE